MNRYLTIHMESLQNEDIKTIARDAMKCVLDNNPEIISENITSDEKVQLINNFYKYGDRIFDIDDEYQYKCDITVDIRKDSYNYLIKRAFQSISKNQNQFIIATSEYEYEDNIFLLSKSNRYIYLDISSKFKL